ncbi:putative Nucleotide pyrophosphatase/phosphodiesterase [Planoprotostelium fungivorum]|uniref:Purple acid phosphatase n=1 Tax=Planoprotostelium fungivorum TaxID=1890364 RepID=A0A2P6MX36_9EUKA|nr:putative Nucleotide pyrophosphatase/phosphodiesterase [Planoprotostelium fungivorum]
MCVILPLAIYCLIFHITSAVDVVSIGYLSELSTTLPAPCTISPSNVNFTAFTHVIISTATYNSSSYQVSLNTSGPDSPEGFYSQIKSAIQSQQTTVQLLLSFFGPNQRENLLYIANDTRRLSSFSDAVYNYTVQHGLDGIDIFWTPWSVNDGALALQMMRVLNSTFRSRVNPKYSDGTNMLVTLFTTGDTTIAPQIGLMDLQPLVDWFHVETIDYQTVQTSPLRVQFSASQSNLVNTIYQYIALGISPSSIVLGISTHGWAWQLSSTTQNTPYSSATGPATTGCSGVPGLLLGREIDEVIYNESSIYHYQSTQSSPYLLYGEDHQRWLSYENNASVSAKLVPWSQYGLRGAYLMYISTSHRIEQNVFSILNSNGDISKKTKLQDDNTKSVSPSGIGMVIVGVVVGVVVGIVMLVITVFAIYRYQMRKQDRKELEELKTLEEKKFLTDYTAPIGKPTPDGNIPVGFMVELLRTGDWDTIDYNEIQIAAPVGKGASGIVYAGKWRGTPVAIKRVEVQDVESARAYLSEIQIMKELRPHSNVVQFLGSSVNAMMKSVFILTQMCDNGSLYDLLHSRVTIEGKVLEKIIRGIAAGMYHLMTEGIVHRDLAARNILLDKTLECKVSDFGLSRHIAAGAENQTQATVGPLKHMAPESLMHSRYSEKSDVWAFGVTLYEIYARTDPYPGYSPVEAVARIISEVRPLRLQPTRNMTAPMRELFNSCFCMEPALRPTFKQLLEALEGMTISTESVKCELQKHDHVDTLKMIEWSRVKRIHPLSYAGIIALLFLITQVIFYFRQLQDVSTPSGTSETNPIRDSTEETDTSITTSDGIFLHVTPKTLYGTEGWLTVNITGVTDPQINDVIAIFCPADKKLIHQRHFPYKFADGTMLGDLYLNKGVGSYRFHLINAHENFRVVFYQNASKSATIRPHSDGGFEKKNLVLLSEELSFYNPMMPTQIRLSVTGVPGQLTVTWLTHNKITDQHVLIEDHEGVITRVEATPTTYREKDMCGWPANSAGYKSPGKIWKATLTRLQPNSKYHYQCGSLDSGYSHKNYFSGPRAADDQTLRIMAAADLGKTNRDDSVWHWPLEKESGVTIEKMKKMTAGSDVMLLVGDTSYAAGSSIQWDEFGHQMSPIASQIPMMTVIGNHEANPNDSGGECSVPYSHRYSHPNNGGDFWYSFDMGPVHFLIFSTEHNFTEKSEQYEWMKRDLTLVNRSATPFLITAAHRPMWFNEWKDSIKTLLQLHLEPLFFRYNVDVCLWGHVHNYYRSCPMYRGECHPKGAVHLLIGNGGFNNGRKLKKAPWLMFQDAGHGFTHLTVTASTMTVKYLSNKSGMLDKLVLKKRKSFEWNEGE